MDIEQLRQYCLSLPAVTEDVKWENDLVFSVGEKMFCSADLIQPLQFSFKVNEDHFEEISNRKEFKPAPYLARAKWVLVTEPSALHTNEWKALFRNSYELVKNKLSGKLKAKLNIN
jgi:predicted DNA-binding protein (MmcQ/YjbR family)